jgi:hypothetical protein
LEGILAFFKVADVRVNKGAPLRALLDGFGVSESLWVGSTGVPSEPRIAAMLHVFSMGRDCYWDGVGKVFTTGPHLTALPGPANDRGVVLAWDLRIKQGAKTTEA